MLNEGFVLASAVHDDSQRMLLGSGVTITNEMMRGLYRRGIRDVVVAERDWHRLAAFSAGGKLRKAMPRHECTACHFQTDFSRALDEELTSLQPCELVPSENPFSRQLTPRGATAYEQVQMDAIFNHHRESVDQVKDLLSRLGDDETVSAEGIRTISKDALLRAADDLDLFVCMGINPGDAGDIAQHSTNTATLAVAIGATLGQDSETLIDLGTGCLVHDAGMLKIDKRYYQSPEFLSASDFVEIAKHPVIATDMLYKNMGRVSLAVRMIVYQMHERCDGSGYPRGRTAESIHPLAKIAAVADAYVALVSKRPHRGAMLPYFAMAKMLEDVKAGLYDPHVVRALLHTISLFPIGSYVELSDGRVGKTIRANGPSYDRPIVEAWRPSESSASAVVADLSEDSELRITKAVPKPRS